MEATGYAGRTSRIASFGAPNSKRAAVVALVVVGVAGATLAWSPWHHSPPVASRAAPSASSVSGFAVTGEVVQEGGEVTQARPLSAVPLVVTGTTAAGVYVTRHLATNAAGRFGLGLAPGRYTVTAILAPTGTVAEHPRARALEPYANVVVRAGHPINLRLVNSVF